MSDKAQATPSNVNRPSNLYPYDEYIRGLGFTRTTGYRYRVRGIIHTSELFGRLFISTEEIQRFEQRVAAGEFRRARRGPTKEERQ